MNPDQVPVMAQLIVVEFRDQKNSEIDLLAPELTCD